MHRFLMSIAVICVSASVVAGDQAALTAALRGLDAAVIAPKSDEAKQLLEALSTNLRSRRDVANRRETANWRAITSRADWEKFRDPRLEALRASLGIFPEPPKDLKVRVTGANKGDGFVVENIVYESRPGLLVTANLYRPAAATKNMPGIIICHSHHNPKTQGELQDMGMTWARLGCIVLVLDQVGHGERRQHPFVDENSYKGSFRPSRQDYYFRYNVGMQLHLIGDSQIGWMAWDMMRGVDLLVQRPDVDAKRIMLLGAVAGGGDPTAVTAAIDPRIAAVVPFNFGGPQPEYRFPLPADADASFNYAGGGSWESTRNLRLNCRDGFLPWVIVGSVAPRGLVYAHEFAWDQNRDPVWQRFQTIYGFYNATDRLSYSHGAGSVRGTGPGNTHCNNIGPVHRKPIYPAFEKWFGMPIPEKEYQTPFSSKELQCLTDAIEITPVHKLAKEIASERIKAVRMELQKSSGSELALLAKRWGNLLGAVAAETRKMTRRQAEDHPGFIAERFALEDVLTKTEVKDSISPEPAIPVLLLIPKSAKDPAPVVVAVAQEGKQAFLQNRAETLAALLDKGVAVCLPDVRGTGEGRSGESRGRSSADTSYSSSALMLGDTFVGARVRDMRTVLSALRSHAKIDAKNVAIWGDSFAKTNSKETNFAVPLDAELPPHSEPLGGLLALFTALYEPDVKAISIRGGLLNYFSVLNSQFCYLPHDVIVPGAITAGDLNTVAAKLIKCRLRVEGMVDGLNQEVPRYLIAAFYGQQSSPSGTTADWLANQLR